MNRAVGYEGLPQDQRLERVHDEAWLPIRIFPKS